MDKNKQHIIKFIQVMSQVSDYDPFMRLKIFRENHLKMSKKEMARAVGIGLATYARYELGTVNPSYASILKLCYDLNLSFDWYLTGEGPMVLKKDQGYRDELAECQIRCKQLEKEKAHFMQFNEMLLSERQSNAA